MGLLSFLNPWRRQGDPEAAAYLGDPNPTPSPQPTPWREPVRPSGRAVSGYADFAPMPPAGMAQPFGVPAAGGPGAFGDFADYANSSMGLRTEPLFLGSQARDIIPNALQPSADVAAADNQAWAEARQRAQAAITQEGYPYWTSPSVRASGAALADAVDANRAAQAERQHRESVSWPEWWFFGGRQAGPTPAGQPAYRFSQAPDIVSRASARRRQGRR